MHCLALPSWSSIERCGLVGMTGSCAGVYRIYRTPSLACAAAVAARQAGCPEDGDAADEAVGAGTAVDMSSTVYMVNPAGDLSSTQATFEETFRQQGSWQVPWMHCTALLCTIFEVTLDLSHYFRLF